MREDLSPYYETSQHSKILNYTHLPNPIPNHLYYRFVNISSTTDVWSRYFYASKSKEGVDVGCILKNRHGDKMLIACHL